MKNSIKYIFIIFSMITIASCGGNKSQDLDPVTPETLTANTPEIMIEDTRPSHAANVQLYRWYQFYERDIFDETRLNNQLDILDENIFIKSAAGEHTGRNGYPARLKAYKGWQNAHHVQNSSVVVNEDGTIALEADILYQNIKPDESEDIYTIHYTTQLKKYDNQALPVFSNIEIQPTGFPEKKAFEDAYPTNRAKSLMYNWMLNMEQLDGNVEPFKEMLTEDFVLNFSTTTPLSSIEELNIWLNGAPLGLKQSSHFPENFSIKTTGENEYEMYVEFDWYGVGKDDSKMRTTTAHTWKIIDNPLEKFARIEQADVKQKEAFRVVSDEEFNRN